MSTAKIAVMGFGVVGSGTVELFYRNKDIIEKRSGTSIDIKYILDLRDFPDSPYRDKFTKSFDDILNDPEVTVAAELMGGKTFAYDYTKRLLSRGKSVVTSNKELVATHGAFKNSQGKRLQLPFRSERRGRHPDNKTSSQMPCRKSL